MSASAIQAGQVRLVRSILMNARTNLAATMASVSIKSMAILVLASPGTLVNSVSILLMTALPNRVSTAVPVLISLKASHASADQVSLDCSARQRSTSVSVILAVLWEPSAA